MASDSTKGFAVDRMFIYIAILLMMMLALAVWLLLSGFFMNYVQKNINSQAKFCETFQQVPILGTIKCPS